MTLTAEQRLAKAYEIAVGASKQELVARLYESGATLQEAAATVCGLLRIANKPMAAHMAVRLGERLVDPLEAHALSLWAYEAKAAAKNKADLRAAAAKWAAHLPDEGEAAEAKREFAKPSLTADIVVFCMSKVLVIRRGGEPFLDHFALPGGFVEEGESAREAAARELREETGLDIPPEDLLEVGAFTEPGRDPRGWVVSVAFTVGVPEAMAKTARAGDDAKPGSAEWFTVADVPKLAFDHAEIIAAAEVAYRVLELRMEVEDDADR